MLWLSVTFLERLIIWDKSLFRSINTHCVNPVFDAIMPFMRKQQHWYPLYLALLVFVVAKFRQRAIGWILFFILTVALTDLTGTNIFKYGFERIRPCNDPDLLGTVRMLVPCPAGFGFTSNHAANHFGMACFFIFTFRHLLKGWVWLGFLWAGLIAFAQVYVGVHFPADVICGALLGVFYGTLTAWLFNRYVGFEKKTPGGLSN